ncbi:MAG: Uma2 family endonuclease [Bacteroidia bacterium]|nr:Uma2 family endonuclease [Bacteroidia bacterium]
MITDISQLDLNKRYTYADYLTWQFDERVELIRGKVVSMIPTPNLIHQEISGNLFIQIHGFIRKSPIKVFAAPFDVRLPLPPDRQTPTKIDTVVQPDLSIICDLSKLDLQGCNGAPDWIIEILSRSTAHKDLIEKFDLYQHAGVKEYWVVHPEEGTLIAWTLNESGLYQPLRPQPFTAPEKVPVATLPGFEVDLEEVFG